MSNYVGRAIKFIEQLYPFLAGIVSSDERYTMRNYYKAVNLFNERYHRHVIVAHGAVRVAFITSDYVVKFDYDPDEAKIYGGCENEYAAFRQIVRDGYAHLFAPITKYTTHGFSFYIMPRVRVCGDCWKNIDDYIESEDEVEYIIENIADLHEENWGFLHGEVKIFDYALSFSRRW